MRTGMIAALAAASSLALASQAAAGIVSGSGARLSVRDCSAPTGSCFGGGVVRGQAGGALAGGSNSISTAGGSVSIASMSFPGAYLPELSLYTKAGASQRAFAEAAAFSTFTYTGAQAIDLALVMNYHYITTGSSLDGLTGNPALEPAGDATGVVGAGIANRSLYADLTTLSTGPDIYTALANRGADRGFGYYATIGTSDEHTIPINVLNFNGAGVRINPGDSFIVAAVMQAVSNRGGEFDAAHTLTLSFDADHTYFAGTDRVVGAALFDDLAVTSAPEPGAWALMLIGLGAIGVRLRAGRHFREAPTAA